MSVNKLLVFFFVLICQFSLAQNDTIQNLLEVIVSDANLKNFSNSKSILIMTDSIIKKNQPSLTSLLNYNSTIYFKENGLGMVSSPSFRGTTAQQTAVVWNGININSQLLGQTDFNTISVRDFNSIVVRAGGGSTIYGSGAIGGSIHLNNEMVFRNQNSTELQQDFGSFSTYSTFLNSKMGTEKLYLQMGFSVNNSKNDYVYVGIFDWKGNKRKNRNGQYHNSSINATLGYKINSNNVLKFYGQSYLDLRHFSLINDTDTKTKYRTTNLRNLLEYDGKFSKLSTNIKLAFLSENYQYFQSIDVPEFSSGKVESFITRVDLGYQLSHAINITSIIDNTKSNGFGSSIPLNTRDISSFSLLISHKLEKVTTELSIRKEVTSTYISPTLFSIGSFVKWNYFFETKATISKNFRMPTFNDLYYNSSGGIGNLNLKPENALQSEISAVFKFKKITFSQTGYFIKTDNLITWFPINSNIWTPMNIKKTESYGLESIVSGNYNFRKHFFSLNATYAYTISKNLETSTQLSYVPFHKATASLGYAIDKLSFTYQFLYNGFVYILLDNKPDQIVKAFFISNIATDYNLNFLKSTKIGFRLSNIFNIKYQSVEDRFMPGTNFTFFTNFKF